MRKLPPSARLPPIGFGKSYGNYCAMHNLTTESLARPEPQGLTVPGSALSRPFRWLLGATTSAGAAAVPALGWFKKTNRPPGEDGRPVRVPRGGSYIEPAASLDAVGSAMPAGSPLINGTVMLHAAKAMQPASSRLMRAMAGTLADGWGDKGADLCMRISNVASDAGPSGPHGRTPGSARNKHRNRRATRRNGSYYSKINMLL